MSALCSNVIKGNHILHPRTGQHIPVKGHYTCDSSFVIHLLKCPCGLDFLISLFLPLFTFIGFAICRYVSIYISFVSVCTDLMFFTHLLIFYFFPSTDSLISITCFLYSLGVRFSITTTHLVSFYIFIFLPCLFFSPPLTFPPLTFPPLTCLPLSTYLLFNIFTTPLLYTYFSHSISLCMPFSYFIILYIFSPIHIHLYMDILLHTLGPSHTPLPLYFHVFSPSEFSLIPCSENSQIRMAHAPSHSDMCSGALRKRHLT